MATILALSAKQVIKLTGLSRRQLTYWDQTSFFQPTYRGVADSAAYSRIYSFKDVVGLRTLARMRQQFRVPLQHLRTVGEHLHAHYEEPWSELSFYIVGRHVLFNAPEAHAIADQSGQRVFEFAVQKVTLEIESEIARAKERTEQDFGKITRMRQVAESKPVISGTRTPTSAIWEFHSVGFSAQEIRSEYPRLTEADIAAAITFEGKKQRRKSA